eukprot:SAG22_NODE_788_length_7234_cov_18.112123_6_plen_348_part_00
MGWELLARQTASAATPTSAHPSASWGAIGGAVDRTADNFSIIKQPVPLYGAGPYTLKMVWPELDGGKGGENVWVQASAPDAVLGKGVKATGYRAVDIQYSGCGWAGLQRCDGAGQPEYVCSLAANGNWWYPIGTSVAWDGDGFTSFSGACNGRTGQTVHKVELWLLHTDPWGWSFLAACLVLGAIYVVGGVRSGGGRSWDKAALRSHPHWHQWVALRGLCRDGVNFARGASGRGSGSGTPASARTTGERSNHDTDTDRGGSRDSGSSKTKSKSGKSSKSSGKQKEGKKGKRHEESAPNDTERPLIAAVAPPAAAKSAGSSGYRGDEWSPPKVQLQSGARETGVKVQY